MRNTILTFIILLNFVFCLSVTSQEIISPTEGNSVVYLVRPTSFGSAHTFRFFHNDKFVGVFKGKGYLRYELPAGKQLLWATSQNNRFLDCDLKPGGIYFVSVMHKPGVGKNHVVLSPVTATDEKYESCKKVVLNNKEITTSDKKKAEIEAKHSKSNFIDTILKEYKALSFKNQTKKISADMAIPLR